MVIVKKENKKLYENVKFVCKAVSDDDTRYYLTGVFNDVENSRLVGTDGRRLHIFKECLPIKQGIYEVKVTAKDITIGKEIEGQFPNYERVTPDYKDIAYELTWSSYRYFDGTDSQNIYKLCQLGFCLNIEYLRDLSGFTFNVSCDPEYTSRAVVFENDMLMAIIMPMRTD